MTVVEQRRKEIESIELSEEEMKVIIWSAKIKKWNEEKNKEYWQELEARKPEAGQTGLRAKTS